jgi:hypothetical protein
MDPLSITVSSLSIARFAAGLGKSIYKFIETTKTVDVTLEIFASELGALSTSLESVGNALETPGFLENASDAIKGEVLKKHLERINLILSDCRKALENLDKVIAKIKSGGRLAHGFMRKPAVALKLTSNTPELQKLRCQVQTYNNATQLCLQTIHL